MNKDRVKAILKLNGTNIGIVYINNNITDGYNVEDVIERLNFFVGEESYTFELYEKTTNNVLGLTPKKSAKKSATPEEV